MPEWISSWCKVRVELIRCCVHNPHTYTDFEKSVGTATGACPIDGFNQPEVFSVVLESIIIMLNTQWSAGLIQ